MDYLWCSCSCPPEVLCGPFQQKMLEENLRVTREVPATSSCNPASLDGSMLDILSLHIPMRWVLYRWVESTQAGERKVFGPDLVTEAEEKVKIIQANLKVAQSRQKSYADKRRDPLQFKVGDFVYLRVSPTRGVQRFGIKGKLAPRYIGPFEIIETCGPVAYRIRLPSQLAAIHDVFHVSQLKKCIKVHTEILEPQDIEVEPDFILR